MFCHTYAINDLGCIYLRFNIFTILNIKPINIKLINLRENVNVHTYFHCFLFTLFDCHDAHISKLNPMQRCSSQYLSKYIIC